MKVLVIGSGGREHALAWKIRQSPRVKEVVVLPGNAGTDRIARNIRLKPTDLPGILIFAQEEGIDLTVVGPDDVLAAGIVDIFQSSGLRIFGPSQNAARLESSKSFAKHFMLRHGIPTARFAEFESSADARSAIDQFGFPLVVKADGLALGKGVIIAANRSEALTAVDDMIERRRFGEAGRKVVFEEFLEGTECSIHALVDGNSYLLFPTAQDHKQIYDGNRGPNTGGMGTCSPSPHLDSARLTKALLVQCGSERMNPGFLVGHCDRSDHGSEHEPARRLVLFRGLRPAESAAAHKPVVDPDRIRPIDRNLLVRRRVGAQRFGQRHHPRIESPTRRAQGLTGLENDSELGKVEPPDIGQRTGAARFGDIDGVGEGVAAFAQPHQSERRRQIDWFHNGQVGTGGRRHPVLQLSFLP